jgi:16S rRNA (guanine527-N7)-methyltransferase
MEFKQEIKQVFLNYDIELTDKQADQFEQYYNMIIEYNKNVNLTAITDQTEVIIKHFLDSVLCYNELNADSSLVDIGAGAGFPGIPLKIVRPDINITMIDGLNKRVVFLNDVIKKLNLTNIVAIHGRCEDFAKKPEFREKFDYCVARAVAKLNTLAEYCLPFVKLYGYMIAYKSRNAQQEIEEATNALSTLGGKLMNIKVVDIFEIEAERNFLFIQKKFKTPLQYPRFQNKPKTNPL